MSLQEALRFIDAVDDDEALREELRRLGPDPTIDDLVELASRAGFELTAEELRSAFVKDWSMRRFRYGGLTDEDPEPA